MSYNSLAMRNSLKIAHLVQSFPIFSETFVQEEIVHLTALNSGEARSAKCDIPQWKFEIKLFAFNSSMDYPGITDDGFPSSMQDKCIYINRFPPAWRLLNFLYGFLCGLYSPVNFIRLCAQLLKEKIPLRNLSAILLLSRTTRENKIDILHAQFGHLGILCLPVKKLLNIPLVTSFRGQDISIVSRLNAKASRSLFTEGEAFLVRSRDMKIDLEKLGCPSEKIKIIHSSVDMDKIRFIERRQPPADSDVIILFVGRFVEKKGPQVAVEAFKKCLRKHANLQLRLVGGGELERKIKSLVESLGISHKVTFLGIMPYSKVIAEMENAHIFLLPCQTGTDGDKEGIPKVLMEAQASGLPVISTFHSGIPECVIDGRTGLLAKEGDADDVSEKLNRLLEHPESWSIMGRVGREHIRKEFNIRKQTAAIATMYKELVTR